MGERHTAIPEKLQRFIESQHVFFVATAPAGGDGRVNVSPKGLNTLRILAPDRVAYLDLTGSGNETSAHLRENGRITFMFCAFSGPPLIVRLYGRGSTVPPGTAQWEELLPRFEVFPGMRQIIVAEIDLVATSCGFGVPFLDFDRERETLEKWARNRGEGRLDTFRREFNAESIDGLPTPLGEAFSPRDSRAGDE
jgi:hypothetical protein